MLVRWRETAISDPGRGIFLDRHVSTLRRSQVVLIQRWVGAAETSHLVLGYIWDNNRNGFVTVPFYNKIVAVAQRFGDGDRFAISALIKRDAVLDCHRK